MPYVWRDAIFGIASHALSEAVLEEVSDTDHMNVHSGQPKGSWWLHPLVIHILRFAVAVYTNFEDATCEKSLRHAAHAQC